jgi:hypothetical protein
MAGAYAFGYMLAVPILATLTDRIDACLTLLRRPHRLARRFSDDRPRATSQRTGSAQTCT